MPELIRYHTPAFTPATRHPWQDDAACANENPEIFFPDAGDLFNTQRAKDICATCPVIAQCKTLGDGYEWGVFDGATAGERRKAQGPWRGSKRRQLELAKKGVPISEIARLCQITENTVRRTLEQETA